MVTSDCYHPYMHMYFTCDMCMHMCMYGKNLYLPLTNTPNHTEGDNKPKPIFRFLGVIFDVDHDFEGP